MRPLFPFDMARAFTASAWEGEFEPLQRRPADLAGPIFYKRWSKGAATSRFDHVLDYDVRRTIGIVGGDMVASGPSLDDRDPD